MRALITAIKENAYHVAGARVAPGNGDA